MVDSVKKSNDNTNISWIILLLIIATMSTISLLLLIPFPNYAYTLPLIVIFGVIDLVAFLTVCSIAFHHIGLSCKEAALGLPRGSIRALIALSLIVIFAIMAIYMARNFETYPLTDINGTIINHVNGTAIIMEPSEGLQDFSMQTLTTVSTLVVAIAGFYFGTRSVEVAKGDVESLSLTIHPESSVTLDLNEQKVLYPIRVKTTPETESVIWEIDDEKNGKIEAVTQNEFKFTPSEKPDDQVTLTFKLAKDSAISEKLKIKILDPSSLAKKIEAIVEDLKILEERKAGIEAQITKLNSEKTQVDEKIEKEKNAEEKTKLTKNSAEIGKKIEESKKREKTIKQQIEAKMKEKQNLLDKQKKQSSDETKKKK